MALNIELMKQKMASLTGKGEKRNDFWRPQEGENISTAESWNTEFANLE